LKPFYFSVKDEAMNGDRINAGDIVLIDKKNAIDSKDIALIYADTEPILRRIHRIGGKYMLIASNAAYAATIHDKITVVGKVIGSANIF
jgi:SOS-response transcriptional repressor LexA